MFHQAIAEQLNPPSANPIILPRFSGVIRIMFLQGVKFNVNN
jgi:hypothetical protein